MTDETTNTKTSSNSVKAGSFEGCFAKGLDLSEFDLNNDVLLKKSSSSSVSASFSSSVLVPGEIKTSTSYSAELLQLRQKEAVQKEIDRQEDERFHAIARDRSAQLQQDLTERAKMEVMPVMLTARHPNDDRDRKTGVLDIIGTSAVPNNDAEFLLAFIGGMHQQEHSSSEDSRGKQRQHRNNRAKKGNSRHQDKPSNPSIKSNTKTSSKFQHKVVAKKSRKSKY